MCFEKRKTPVRCLCVLSGIAVIFGILIAVFAFLFTGSAVLQNMEKENSSLETARKSVFLVLLIFALVTIIVAALGFFFKCCKNKCFYCLYGILLLPTCLIIIAFGAVATIVSTASGEHVKTFCDELNAKTTTSTTLNGDTEVNISLDIYEILEIDDYMCSISCPCKSTIVSSQWTNDAPAGRTYNFDGTFETYKECIDETAANTAATGDFKKFADAFVSKNEYEDISKWVAFFEGEYECAGICTAADFYWDLPVSKGKPTQNCLDSIIDDLTLAFQGLAITSLLAGLFLFFVFIFQYCLWKKYD